MTLKGSFEETAVYWTQIYAGGLGRKDKANGACGSVSCDGIYEE